MCGRYAFFDTKKLYERFGVNERLNNLTPRYNVTPGAYMPTIIRESPPRVVLMRWGLVPHWAKDLPAGRQVPKIGYRMINARAETVSEKPAYAKPYKKQRCLVPANGFFEWQKYNGKQPYYIYVEDRPIMALAGLWDKWVDGEGKETLSYTILTTAANETVAPIHDRMPVVLTQEAEAVWTDPLSKPTDLLTCLEKAKQTNFTCRPVSNKVNRPSEDGPDLIRPIDKKG